VVHAVDEEDVEVAAVGVHRFDARRAPPAPGVRGAVFRPEIRLGLDDARAVPPAAPAPSDPGADEVARDTARLAAKERACRLAQAESARVDGEAGVGGCVRYHR
jgi:hypothetical protein